MSGRIKTLSLPSGGSKQNAVSLNYKIRLTCSRICCRTTANNKHFSDLLRIAQYRAMSILWNTHPAIVRLSGKLWEQMRPTSIDDYCDVSSKNSECKINQFRQLRTELHAGHSPTHDFSNYLFASTVELNGLTEISPFRPA